MLDWWERLTALWWPDDTIVRPEEDVRRWLQSKHDVAARLQPATIGEFGVRAGYSAFAMLSAVDGATYLGIDVDSPDFGSEAGALAHGRVVMQGFTPAALIVQADSHVIRRLPPLDLLHIDGDHSFAGCTMDLLLAERSGVVWVLVDDYDHSEIVRAAVDQFAAGRLIEHIDDGFRGSALMRLT